MMASRGMGAIASSKMPGAKTKKRKDNTEFNEFSDGGLAKTKNSAKLKRLTRDLRKLDK